MKKILDVLRAYPGIRYNLIYAALSLLFDRVMEGNPVWRHLSGGVHPWVSICIVTAFILEGGAVTLLIRRVRADESISSVTKEGFGKLLMWLVLLELPLLLIFGDAAVRQAGVSEGWIFWLVNIAVLGRQGWLFFCLHRMDRPVKLAPSAAVVEAANLLLFLPMLFYSGVLWNGLVDSFVNYGSYFNLLDPGDWVAIGVFGALGAAFILLPMRLGWFIGELREKADETGTAIFWITLVIYLGTALFPIAKPFSAEDYYERAGLRSPGTNLSRYKDALSDYGSAVRIAPRNPKYYLGKADLLIRGCDYHVAVRFLESYHLKGWLDADGLSYLSMAYAWEKKYTESEACAEEARVKSPTNAMAYAARARLYLCEGKKSEAHAEAKAALGFSVPGSAAELETALVLLDGDWGVEALGILERCAGAGNLRAFEFLPRGSRENYTNLFLKE